MKMTVKRMHCHMYLEKERRLSSTQGKKSNSHKRGLGRAEGRYKHVGVGERKVQEGAMFLQALQVGGGKTWTGAGYWGGGTLCLWLLHCSLRVAQPSLPSGVNFGASVSTNQVDPASSFKADGSPAQRLCTSFPRSGFLSCLLLLGRQGLGR